MKRILVSTVVLDHIVIPEAQVEIVTLSAGGLEALDHTWMHQVATGLEVNDVVLDARLASVREIGDAIRCLQESLFGWLNVANCRASVGLRLL